MLTIAGARGSFSDKIAAPKFQNFQVKTPGENL